MAAAAEAKAGGAVSREELLAQVEEARRRLAELGPVNQTAVEEFEQAKERLGFLSGQRDDLVSAKAELVSFIAEMDQAMQQKFLATFRAIKEQFSTIFTDLFGGGRAELGLADPEHPLETAIEILAQPPGKTLQNLGLLSGGEKALTAIALLFAVLAVKPSPFVVLDEIDAALDETNVDRFAGYLRRVSATTQFIVITHQKRTMEVADALYGVTMEGSGVSKLVAVKMEDEVQEASARGL